MSLKAVSEQVQVRRKELTDIVVANLLDGGIYINGAEMERNSLGQFVLTDVHLVFTKKIIISPPGDRDG